MDEAAAHSPSLKVSYFNFDSMKSEKGLALLSDLPRAWQARLARTVQTTRLLAEIRGLKTVEQRLDAWLSQNEALPTKGHWQNLAQELSVSPEAFYREIARRRALKA
ncbi:MAG: hypothetical protein AAF999_15500 [Pseudomonadota bacterium]